MSPEASRLDSPLDRLCVSLATLFGVGYFPKIPGTFSSLLTLPFAYYLTTLGPFNYWVVTLFVGIVSVPVSDRAAKFFGQTDPPCIVIDELFGILITVSPFCFVQHYDHLRALPLLLLSFGFFRFFDILKPSIVGKAQKFRGGFGIVADDAVAGVLAAFATFLAGAALEPLNQLWK